MDTINRQPYPTDLTDTEWAILAPLFPPAPVGRPRIWPVRELLNAMFYVVRSGGAWRQLPHDPQGSFAAGSPK